MYGWKDTVNVPVFLGKFHGLTNLAKLLVSNYYVYRDRALIDRELYRTEIFS